MELILENWKLGRVHTQEPYRPLGFIFRVFQSGFQFQFTGLSTILSLVGKLRCKFRRGSENVGEKWIPPQNLMWNVQMWSVLCLLCVPRGKLSWGIICQSCDPVLSVVVREGHGRHANRWRCGESGRLWWRILGGMPISDIHRFRPTFILAGYVDGLQGKLKRIWSGKQETWIPLYDTLYGSFQRLKPFSCPLPSKYCSKKIETRKLWACI